MGKIAYKFFALRAASQRLDWDGHLLIKYYKEDYSMHYWNIQAVNTRTGQRITQQHGGGYRTTNEEEALALAESLAQKNSQRSRDTWVGKIEWVLATD